MSNTDTMLISWSAEAAPYLDFTLASRPSGTFTSWNELISFILTRIRIHRSETRFGSESLLYVQGRSRKKALPVTLKMNVFLRVGHFLKLHLRHYITSADYHYKDNVPQNPAITQRLCNEVGSWSLSRLFTGGVNTAWFKQRLRKNCKETKPWLWCLLFPLH